MIRGNGCDPIKQIENLMNSAQKCTVADSLSNLKWIFAEYKS